MQTESKNFGPKLSIEQKEAFIARLVSTKDTKPVRFLFKGQALDIVTGELSSKGSNVMYHQTYWNIPLDAAKEIADILGCKLCIHD